MHLIKKDSTNQLPLIERDSRILHIEELIEAKRKMLSQKQKQLKKIIKQNNFLDFVKSDYDKYFNYINQQKKDQITALELLNNYINDLTISGKLTQNNIEDAKNEQTRILSEVKTIQNSLESIIDNTNHINSQLEID